MAFKKVTKGNHLPSIEDGRFPVYSKQFNELVDDLNTSGLSATGLSINSISEKTSDSGVTVDGVLLKDGGVKMTTGTATQTVGITNGVTLSTPTGVITTVSATTAAQASAIFTLTNSYLTATSVIKAWIIDYAGTFSTNGIPIVTVDNRLTSGVDIVISNVHGTNALNGVLKIGFAILG